MSIKLIREEKKQKRSSHIFFLDSTGWVEAPWGEDPALVQPRARG